MISGIYKIFNNVTNKFYIGSSVNVQGRLNTHFKMLDKGIHVNSYLQHAYNKYGYDSFDVELLLICDACNLLYFEQLFLTYYYNHSILYNLSPSATGSAGLKWSVESRHRISVITKGRIPWNKGIKMSDEFRFNMRKMHTGKKLSYATKSKISDKLRGSNHPMYGKHHTNETKEKISARRKTIVGCNHPMYGKHHTNETKEKIRLANIGNKHALGNTSRSGIKHTTETKAKISNSRLSKMSSQGYLNSAETRKKMSESAKLAWKRRKETNNGRK